MAGICNVLAVIPFLCSAPAEEPPEDEQEQLIEAQPAPEVQMGTLEAPTATRPVSEYEVLPPASSRDVEYGAVEETPTPRGQNANSFSDWVSQNWGGETEVAAAEPVVPAPEPRLDLASSSPASRPSTVDEMTQPEMTVEPEPQPYEMREPEPRLARLDPAPDPAPMMDSDMDPDVELAERQDVATAMAGPATAETNRVARTATPQPQPERRSAPATMQSAAAIAATWDPGNALRAGNISFAEPQPLTERGARVEADSIAARKRRDVRRLEREIRRAERDRTE